MHRIFKILMCLQKHLSVLGWPLHRWPLSGATQSRDNAVAADLIYKTKTRRAFCADYRFLPLLDSQVFGTLVYEPFMLFEPQVIKTYCKDIWSKMLALYVPKGSWSSAKSLGCSSTLPYTDGWWQYRTTTWELSRHSRSTKNYTQGNRSWGRKSWT